MNILFVHEVDWLNKVVFDVHTLSESLSLLHHEVYAIDYENSWSRNGIMDLGNLSTKEFNKTCRAFPLASVTLRRPGFIKIRGLSRLSAGLTHYMEIQHTIKDRNIDAIVLYSVPTNGLQTIYLARKYNIPVVFRSIDILNQLVPYPVLRPITKFLEKKIYSEVDMILTLTPSLSRYVISMGANKNRVKLLPMPVDMRLFHPTTDSLELRQKWGFNEEDRIVLFIGTLFEFSGLDALIPQFTEVTKRIPLAKLLIVGDGPQRYKLEKMITELGFQKQIIITGFQPYETMPQYINLSTVCINTFLTTNATRDIFPGKIVQYLACGKPVIATALPGMMAVIPGEGQGIIYAHDSNEIAKNIISLLQSEKRRYHLGEAALNYVGQFHDHERIARQLEAAIKEVREEKRR